MKRTSGFFETSCETKMKPTVVVVSPTKTLLGSLQLSAALLGY